MVFAFAPHDPEVSVTANLETGWLYFDLAPNCPDIETDCIFQSPDGKWIISLDNCGQVIGVDIAPHGNALIDELVELRRAVRELVTLSDPEVIYTGVQGFPEGK